MFDKVLVANRGEIALPHHPHAAAHGRRLGRGLFGGRRAAPCTCAPADEAVVHRAGAGRRELPATPTRSSRRRAAPAREAIHPGYGFLAENAEFAARCEAAGIALHRPDARADPRASVSSTRRASWRPRPGLPLLPGTDAADQHRAGAARRRAHRLPGDAARAPRAAAASACAAAPTAGELAAGVRGGRAAGARPTSSTAGSLPREVRRPRAPRRGADLRRRRAAACWRSGERDCSLQRRNQKVIEETPPPGLSPRPARGAATTRRCAWGTPRRYRSAGTVEFVVDARDAGRSTSWR